MIILLALLIAIPLALFGGYRVFKWSFPPRPTFHALPDSGSSSLNEGRETPVIDFQLVLNPSIAGGQCRIRTDEPGLIRFVRRKNV